MNYNERNNLRRKARKKVDNLLQQVGNKNFNQVIHKPIESYTDETDLSREGCLEDMIQPDTQVELMVLNEEECLDNEDCSGCNGASSVVVERERMSNLQISVEKMADDFWPETAIPVCIEMRKKANGIAKTTLLLKQETSCVRTFTFLTVLYCKLCGCPVLFFAVINRRSTDTATRARNADFTESVIRTILTNQEVIKEQMGILVKLVYDLKGTAEESASLPPETLPIASLQDLQVLEGHLHDKEFKKTLMATLAQRGGTAVKDTVWRVMGYLLTNAVAKQLNWKGVSGKAAFKNLTLKGVVTDAVRRNRLTATDQEIEHWIKR